MPVRATDLLVAEMAIRGERASEAEIADCLAQQADEKRAGKALSLGQILLKRHKLRAEEFVEVTRRLEERLLKCPACGRPHSAREIDEAAGAASGERAEAPAASPRCLDCG